MPSIWQAWGGGVQREGDVAGPGVGEVRVSDWAERNFLDNCDKTARNFGANCGCGLRGGWGWVVRLGRGGFDVFVAVEASKAWILRFAQDDGGWGAACGGIMAYSG